MDKWVEMGGSVTKTKMLKRVRQLQAVGLGITVLGGLAMSFNFYVGGAFMAAGILIITVFA